MDFLSFSCIIVLIVITPISTGHEEGESMAGNKSLNAAAAAKQDEFYTQITDIEKELRHYRKHFAGKTILCNCDDPFESNFFKYFVLNFNRLGLAKLIATCYAGSPIVYTQMNLFGEPEEVVQAEREKKPYKVEVTQVYDTTGDGGVDMLDVAELFRTGKNSLELLEGDGDFRSPECLALLDEADIVVTNPPFSLFREYVGTLMEHRKKFIIIGSLNAVKYREIFSHIMNDELWLGYGNGDMAFRVPHYFEPRETRFWIDENGDKWRSLGNIAWFTNLDIKKRHEDIILVKRYSPENYIKFDNYDAIIIDKLADIPCDYAGIMGVPITFMNCYNPEQFEIFGRTGNIEWATSECTFFAPPSEEKQRIYKQQNKTWRVQNGYYVTPDGIAHTVYDRLFIRNKRPEG